MGTKLVNLAAERSQRRCAQPDPGATVHMGRYALTPARRASRLLLDSQLAVDEVRGRVGTVYLLPADYGDVLSGLQNAASRYLFAARRLQVRLAAEGYGAADGEPEGAA